MNKKIIIAVIVLVIVVVLSHLTNAYNSGNIVNKYETQAECESGTGEKCKCMLSKTGIGVDCLEWNTQDTWFR